MTVACFTCREKASWVGSLPVCRKVYLAAFASLILAISMGLVVGFPATSLVDMDREDSPIHPSPEMKTWIASVTGIGEFIGCLLAAPLSEKFGRRQSLILVGVPYLTGWLCIILSQSVELLLAGRVITGLCCGISVAIVPTYTIEISSPEIRGLLGSSFQVFFVFGILLSNIVGWVVSWPHLSIFSATMPVLSVCLLYFMPESPRWLVRKGRSEEAVKAITFLHGTFLDPVKEVSAIEADIKQQSGEEKFKLSDMTKTMFWKPAVLSLTLMVFKELSGICNFLYYSVDIFRSAGTSINSHMSAVIVSVIQTLATLMSALIVDKAGRRILLSLSSLGLGFSLILLGSYFLIKEKDISVSSQAFEYLPLISIIAFFISYSIGYGPIPWVMMNELSPLRSRSIVCSLGSFLNSIGAFATSKTFMDLQKTFGKSGSFYFYGGISLFGIIFVWCFIPETKGKPLEEILEYFTTGKNSEKKEKENKEVFTITHM